MKNLYRIIDARGITLCHQIGTSERDALNSARVYYGFRSARRAEFVRGDE